MSDNDTYNEEQLDLYNGEEQRNDIELTTKTDKEKDLADKTKETLKASSEIAHDDPESKMIEGTMEAQPHESEFFVPIMKQKMKNDFEDQKAEFIPKLVSHLIDWCKTCEKNKKVNGRNPKRYRSQFVSHDYAYYRKWIITRIISEAFELSKSIRMSRDEEVDVTNVFVGRHKERIAEFIWQVQQTNGIVTENTRWPMDLKAFRKCLETSQKALIKAAAAGQTDTAMFHPAVKSKSLPLAERVSAYVSAYDTITVTASLVFSFGVSLAAEYSSEEQFENAVRMYIFHIFISSCIASALHCIAILTLINYRTNRHLGSGLTDKGADFIELTYKYRNHARLSFCLSLLLFVLSLCVLYFDGLPTVLAVINTTILTITTGIVVGSVTDMTRG
eukprot:289022_1